MATVLTPKDFATATPSWWCPGCGDYGVLSALKQALSELGKIPKDVALRAGLRAGALLQEQELSSGMVGSRFVQVDDDLQREDKVSVEVAVQGVPVPPAVAQQDRRRLVLPGVVVHAQPFIQGVRPRGRAAEFRVPVAGDRQQPGI